MFAEEVGELQQNGRLGGGGEPVVFVGQDVELVFDAEGCQAGGEVVGVMYGDDGVLVAVQDLRGWEAGGRFRGVGFDEASGEIDQAADFAACRGVFGGGALGCEAEREEAAEGDADERDARGVDVRAGGDDLERGAEGVDPERDVNAIDDGFVVGSLGVGAVEVVRSEEREAGAGNVRGDAAGPPVDVAARAVHEHDGGDALVRWWRLVRLEADALAADLESFLHR